jgi:hypothetical protein
MLKLNMVKKKENLNSLKTNLAKYFNKRGCPEGWPLLLLLEKFSGLYNLHKDIFL